MPDLLIAADAQWVIDDIVAALGAPGTSLRIVRDGKAVVAAVRDETPDLVVLDQQIGNMGAMAITMALRLEQSGGRLPRVPILVLLDRQADIFLAQRSEADGWLVKPVNARRLHRAATTILAGGTFSDDRPTPSQAAAAAAVGAAATEVAPDAEPEGVEAGVGG